MNNLVIVESPAKAKTIEKYLGSDFKVLSSVGHIRSIAKKPKKGLKAIDTANNFKTIYEIDPDKKKVITGLKKAVKEAKEVWLATDEDREGEAIAWHLAEVLGLDIENSKRIVFHEITKPAIENAIKNPRKITLLGNEGVATSAPLMVSSIRNPIKENENARRKPCLNDQG